MRKGECREINFPVQPRRAARVSNPIRFIYAAAAASGGKTTWKAPLCGHLNWLASRLLFSIMRWLWENGVCAINTYARAQMLVAARGCKLSPSKPFGRQHVWKTGKATRFEYLMMRAFAHQIACWCLEYLNFALVSRLTWLLARQFIPMRREMSIPGNCVNMMRLVLRFFTWGKGQLISSDPSIIRQENEAEKPIWPTAHA